MDPNHSEPSRAQIPLAGGPTSISRRMLELWRGRLGKRRLGQVTVRAGNTAVHVDRVVLMAWYVSMCD